jgi:peptidoglycan/LPS O-acetylase OafA/YrhL
LSGYLITGLLLRCDGMPPGRALREFYLRRALRVFPAYFLVVLTAAALLSLPYLRELAQLRAGWQSNGIHLWSMDVEEQFYLLYPPLLLLTPARWRSALLALGLGCCIVTRVALAESLPHSYYGALPAVPGEYILWGCLLAWLDHRGRLPWASRPACLYAPVLAFLALVATEPDLERYLEAQMQPPPYRQTLYAVTLAVFILGLRHNRRAWLSRGLAWKPFRALGKVSYGAYLVHLFLNPLVDSLLARFPALAIFPEAPRAVLGPIVALGAAGLMWFAFEGRLNGAKDRLTSSQLSEPAKE